MSRTLHARPRRPSPALARRVACALESEQRTVGALAAELGVSPEAVRSACRTLGLRIERVVTWCGRPTKVEVVAPVRRADG